MIDTILSIHNQMTYINHSQSDECSNKYLEKMSPPVSIRIRLKLYYAFKIRWKLKNLKSDDCYIKNSQSDDCYYKY